MTSLCAQTEAGPLCHDPSEDMLYELLSDLDHDDPALWVMRMDEGDGDHFFRIELLDDGTLRRRFALEQRDGDAGRRAEGVSQRAAHAAVTRWALRLGDDAELADDPGEPIAWT